MNEFNASGVSAKSENAGAEAKKRFDSRYLEGLKAETEGKQAALGARRFLSDRAVLENDDKNIDGDVKERYVSQSQTPSKATALDTAPKADEASADTSSLPPYSVLISVYAGEKADNLKQSLGSVLSQSYPPDEIVLVKDGPLTEELDKVILEAVEAHRELFDVIALEANTGLGNALNVGLNACMNEYVARMDSDDVCRPDRMLKQMTYLSLHPDVDILSGAIEEFDGDITNVTSKRVVPLTDENIKKFAKTRCPFNHNCVVYKKSKVEKVRGYRTDLKRVEDHDLWMRMFAAGAVGANLEETLLYARAGHGLHAKRHGGENAKALYMFYRDLYRLKEISLPRFIYDIVCACGLQLMPTWMHKLCYKLIRLKTRPYGEKGARKPKNQASYPANVSVVAPTEDEIKRDQKLILEIYRDVKALCDAHGLCLMLGGGSCLGAVRHNGFIPWDDDMDSVMPRDDYERLKLVFDSALGDKYALQVPNLDGHTPSNLFMKVVRRGEPFVRQINQYNDPGEKGLWLDIVPMEYAPEGRLKRVAKGLVCDLVAYTAVSVYLFTFRNPVYAAHKKRTVSGRLGYYSRNCLGFLMSFMNYRKWYDLFDRISQSKEKTGLVTFPAGIKHYLGECMPLDTFFPEGEGEFEGERVVLPGKAHVYLRHMYGADYMKLPPENERKTHLRAYTGIEG